MKPILTAICILLTYQINLFAGENTIDFRLAYEHEKPDTFIAFDKSVGKLFVGNTPVIKISDIKEAKLIIDSKDPPVWLDTAVKLSGTKILQPQIRIEITFNKFGKERFSQITSDNIGKRIAIFIDNKLVMAPKVMERIDSGKTLITTSYTEDETRKLVNKINENIK